MLEGVSTLAVVALGALALGFFAGFWVGRNAGPDRRIKAERDAAREKYEHYRAQVAAHFGETSRRLHALTVEYRAVYDHLAASAEALCPEGFEALGRIGGEERVELPEAAPEARTSQAARATSDAQAKVRQPAEAETRAPAATTRAPATVTPTVTRATTTRTPATVTRAPTGDAQK